MDSVTKSRITSIAHFKIQSEECLFDFALIYPAFATHLPSGNLKRRCLNRSKAFLKQNYQYIHSFRCYGLHSSGDVFFASSFDNPRVYNLLLELFASQNKQTTSKEFLFYLLNEDRLIGCYAKSPLACIHFINGAAAHNNVLSFDQMYY